MGLVEFVKGEIKMKSRVYTINTEGTAPSAHKDVAKFVEIAAKLAKVTVSVKVDIWPRIGIVVWGKKKHLNEFEEQLSTLETATFERVKTPNVITGKTAYLNTQPLTGSLAKLGDLLVASKETATMLTVNGYSEKYGVPASTVCKWCSKGVLLTVPGKKPTMIPDDQGKPVKNPETGVWVFVMPDGNVRQR